MRLSAVARVTMRLTLAPPLAWSALATFPLHAQSNAERIANDRYSRSHDFDLLHERIEVRDFDWAGLRFNGRVTITVRALRPAFDSVVLDAGALLAIDQIAGPGRAGGRPAAADGYRFEHIRDTLIVHLPRPAGFGDTVRFTIDYRAAVKNGHGLTFIDADSAEPARPRQIWSQGEEDNNHHWFPTYDFPNDRMTWELIATVPKGFTAVSNGRLVRDRVNGDGTRTLQWAQDRPAVTYLVSLVVAPLVKIADRWRNVPVDYYVYREDSARARRLFGVTPDMIELYSRLTGVDYPWAKYAQTTVADFFGGMENVSATTLVDWLPDGRAFADRPWYRHILIPHELAHQWFGDYVTTANWANFWLNEGFAEFMPGQYWAVRLGPQAGQDYYLDEYRQFVETDRHRRMPLASLGSNNVYPKGALVLEMLRKYLGDQRFWAGVKRYLRDHALDVATSDDLRQAFLRATGENLDWFWEQWIYQAGYPEFEVSAAWDSATSTVALTVRQTQRDTLKPDSTGLRYSVPEVFRMPVTVRVGTASGDVMARELITDREQVLRVPGVLSPPTMVIFDADNAILKQLAFNQQTAWLAVQLSRDPNLWNRAWVIGQLGARHGDDGALAALRQAATGSDYFLTRAQAAQALAGFEGAAASVALQQALRDSSAQVRAAAVTALAEFPSTEVQAAVRRTWEGDTSYTVRAAALASIAQLDSAGARAALLQGLRTPSYQAVIEDAALVGIFQTGDTALLEEISRAVGPTHTAGLVLGAFAARGNQRALELLEQLVQSRRAVVRQQALQAFPLTLPSALARQRLEALKEKVADERIRGEIQAALDRLKP
ncbi:MAG TPA: M1 family aminopeptidase [Gemmatimonadales bacterium]